MSVCVSTLRPRVHVQPYGCKLLTSTVKNYHRFNTINTKIKQIKQSLLLTPADNHTDTYTDVVDVGGAAMD